MIALSPPPPGPPQHDDSPAAGRRVFWRNFLLIAAGHVAILLALFTVSLLRPKPKPDEVLWLDGGSLGGAEIAASAEPETAPAIAEPEPPVQKIEEPIPEPTPPTVEKKVESEIVEPKATPKPATPKPSTPKPATPKATPATKSKATPAASSKPKADASPKPAATPKPNGKGAETAKVTPSPDKAKGGNSTAGSGAKDAKSKSADGGAGKGKGTGKTGSGGGGISQFGWYMDSLHDYYYSRWEQPVGIGQDVIATVKLRILKDGTIAKHDMVKSSGNPQMDESVMSAVEKVKQIDPLPAGLGNGEYFDLNVAFKVGG